MATVASFGDLLVMLVAGDPNSRKQQEFNGHDDRSANTLTVGQQVGRPYQSLEQFDGLKMPVTVGFGRRLLSFITLPQRLVAVPFRALRKIGEYDARRTR